MSSDELLVKKHVKYFQMCLNVLPSRLQKEDSNKLMIIYCCIAGLSILKYQFTIQEKTDLLNFIYEHLVDTGEGFRGSLTHKLYTGAVGANYDPPTIANTYCALCILSMIEEDFTEKLDKLQIMKYLIKCQDQEDGSIRSIVDINDQPFGDGDLRQTYMALCIRKMLNYNPLEYQGLDLNLSKIEENILGQICFDGGLGLGESHAGYTFCGLTSLKLIGKLNTQDSRWNKTINWLIHRQIDFNEYNKELLNTPFGDDIDIGSHNGRDNKFGDTCYSFWCSSSLALFDKEFFIDGPKTEKYLLEVTQNNILGGFAKSDADDPDPYHSFLALSALTIINSHCKNELEPIDPLLSITLKASTFLKKD
ncbi:Geranylgeranyl transferase type-1 subunit beta [Wickerhamomyces ciferrii]|uniref:Geranylgeranyl transferase type-1 subunit beta n=1 Tax=Wickerhamomyces ciferrii (strain ATCC 14091 / BCRC 22168 / CBS 111 / JCM 3599 / NBRC 0793 / NRRL Y-1031 F-60-10) TaxID=1206466 RepID=K0KKW5_WICCF|nr:Geranylgeranyl transferase type-1 subunit beta [Wickerhamomyces ciferrii]CCH42099.1 Geranylgeranyl transferase type-1 subunit beta [Wickerhamomyces ciferrii]